jgi:hypothetical protein
MLRFAALDCDDEEKVAARPVGTAVASVVTANRPAAEDCAKTRALPCPRG